jgi:hypothetical protein
VVPSKVTDAKALFTLAELYKVIRIATEPSGGYTRRKRCPNRLLLDKEQERREIPVWYSIQDNWKLVGGHGGISRRAVFWVAQVWSLLHPAIYRLLTDLRFWGRKFRYDESVMCIRRSGIIPRKGKNALKDPNPIASTSTRPEEQELDEEQDEEADEDAMQDESFNADWSRDLMCVADPFVITKVGVLPSLRWCSLNVLRLSELCRSDQEVNLYPVHSRMQEHREHVTTGDTPRVNSIQGASCLAKFGWSPKKGQERKE